MNDEHTITMRVYAYTGGELWIELAPNNHTTICFPAPDWPTFITQLNRKGVPEGYTLTMHVTTYEIAMLHDFNPSTHH